MPGDTLPAPFEWGRVEIEARRVAIIACGPSVAALDLDLVKKAADAGVHVIAVNNAVMWAPVVHSWITIDPGRKNLRLMREPRPRVTYYAGVPSDFATPASSREHHREPAPPGVIYFRRLSGDYRPGRILSDRPTALRSGNSAFAALNAAYLARPERIALFGVDGSRDGYAYARGRPAKRFDHLDAIFSDAKPQLRAAKIKVVNASPKSIVRSIDRTDPNNGMRWLFA